MLPTQDRTQVVTPKFCHPHTEQGRIRESVNRSRRCRSERYLTNPLFGRSTQTLSRKRWNPPHLFGEVRADRPCPQIFGHSYRCLSILALTVIKLHVIRSGVEHRYLPIFAHRERLKEHLAHDRLSTRSPMDE
jgi:hypothetical protein